MWRKGLVWPSELGGRGGMAFRDWGVGLVGLVASPLIGFPWRRGGCVGSVECLPDGHFICSKLVSGSAAIFVVNSSVEALQYLNAN